MCDPGLDGLWRSSDGRRGAQRQRRTKHAPGRGGSRFQVTLRHWREVFRVRQGDPRFTNRAFPSLPGLANPVWQIKRQNTP